MRKILVPACLALLSVMLLTGADCNEDKSKGMAADREKTIFIGDRLAQTQPTPTDITYSLERYNLIRRTYWVNGHRARAMAMRPPIAEMPLGYVVLLTNSGAVFGKFVVDGKITSLQSHLTPDSEYFEIATGASSTYRNRWLADVDGAYGTNDAGIFFFTPDKKYVEWNGLYFYSDIPLEIEDTVLRMEMR